MKKIGKYWYKNWWGFILVNIFRQPGMKILDKKWRPNPLHYDDEDFGGMSAGEFFEAANFHEDCGDR